MSNNIVKFPGTEKASPMPGNDLADTINCMTPAEQEEFAQRIRSSVKGNAQLLGFADTVDPSTRGRGVRDPQDVAERIEDHREAVFAYSRAVAWEAAAADLNLPSKLEEARQRTAEASNKMHHQAWRLFIIAPTDLRALVDLLMYLEKNFSTLPATITHGGSSEQSIAFSLLRTMRRLDPGASYSINNGRPGRRLSLVVGGKVATSAGWRSKARDVGGHLQSKNLCTPDVIVSNSWPISAGLFLAIGLPRPC
jgi:hypothetical protein